MVQCNRRGQHEHILETSFSVQSIFVGYRVAFQHHPFKQLYNECGKKNKRKGRFPGVDLKALIMVLADIIMNVVEMLQSQFQVISCSHLNPQQHSSFPQLIDGCQYFMVNIFMSRWPLRSFKLHRKNTASKFSGILSHIKAVANDSSSQGDVRSSDT